jgi:hypothetical protein
MDKKLFIVFSGILFLFLLMNNVEGSCNYMCDSCDNTT